jgi:uncharacterized membrane protein YfcA
MSEPTVATDALLCLCALVAGALNAIAGGGTLLTFPALLAVVPPVIANATSTVALVPGSLAGAWGYRQELVHSRRWLRTLILPCLLGGVVGTLLVVRLPEQYFARVVPWLVLTATLLFMMQPGLSQLTGLGTPHRQPSRWVEIAIIVFQFLVAVYGGYFGAGIGILMLSSLAFLGIADIHALNALKTFLAAAINSVAVGVFVIEDKVNWRLALIMTTAAIVGGYGGARMARRLNRNLVRWVVILIGLGLTVHLFLHPPAASTYPSQGLAVAF